MTPTADKDRRLDELIARRAAESAQTSFLDETATARVVAGLITTPLPQQRRVLFGSSWPNVLLDFYFAPAWPRVAALACAAVLGCAIGLFGLDARIAGSSDWAFASTPMPNAGLSAVSEPELLTGVRP